MARSEMEFSEWDCELECMRWFQTHEKQDGSCLWKGNEFRQHIGSSSQASSEAVNPPEPTTAKPAENPAPPASIQVNVGSGEVETETIPLTVYHLKLGSTIPIFFDFVPTIWVDSPRLIQVIAGKDGHYILVTAKRREPPFVSTIIVADQSGAATRKIIVFVE